MKHKNWCVFQSMVVVISKMWYLCILYPVHTSGGPKSFNSRPLLSTCELFLLMLFSLQILFKQFLMSSMFGLMGGREEDGAKLLSEVYSKRRRGSRHREFPTTCKEKLDIEKG